MAAENHCPACGDDVVDTHECTEQWEEPDEGRSGSETTRCEVRHGRLLVSVSGESSTDPLHLALQGGGAEAFLMGQSPDPAEIPEAER